VAGQVRDGSGVSGARLEPAPSFIIIIIIIDGGSRDAAQRT
jgi:hypothetical protein